MINVYELIGKKDLMDLTDAEILKNKIKELLQKGEKVVVSFSGIEMIYTLFLQKSIGELYLEIEDITDLDKIEFKYLNDDQDLLEYIINNFKHFIIIISPTSIHRFRINSSYNISKKFLYIFLSAICITIYILIKLANHILQLYSSSLIKLF